jgi:hypothetical protein
MFVAIRRYTGCKDVCEVNKCVVEDLIPTLRGPTGFRTQSSTLGAARLHRSASSIPEIMRRVPLSVFVLWSNNTLQTYCQTRRR